MDIIEPGAILGIVGGGQLGRMFALAARQMGYRIHVWSDEPGPASSCADHVTIADYLDFESGKEFRDKVAAVTFETEKLPVALFEWLAEALPVRPGVDFLHMSQNRIREKTGLQGVGLPVGPFQPVRSEQDLVEGLKVLGTPAILKTASGGYDGKGQVRINQPNEASEAWRVLQTDEAILEAFVPFVDEVSVVAARDVHGNCVTYGPIHNTHRNHILDISYCPAELPASVNEAAIAITTKLADAFQVVGVFCVELFVLADGQVWINEIAPRPHNSGHLTIEGHQTSQFQQQVRCLCGLPVGSPSQRQPAAMANLLGDVWAGGPRDWLQMSRQFPAVQWHLYGKEEARNGRKMGHLTATATTSKLAVQAVNDARESLHRR